MRLVFSIVSPITSFAVTGTRHLRRFLSKSSGTPGPTAETPDKMLRRGIRYATAMLIGAAGLTAGAHAQTAHLLGWTSSLTGAYQPYGVVIDPSSNIYYSVPQGQLIYKVPFNGGQYGSPVSIPGNYT